MVRRLLYFSYEVQLEVGYAVFAYNKGNAGAQAAATKYGLSNIDAGSPKMRGIEQQSAQMAEALLNCFPGWSN